MSTIVTIVDDQDKRYLYKVDRDLPPIGKGGMGTVYRGIRVDTKNPSEQRPVAIKFIHDNLDFQVVEREKRTADICIQSENVVEMMGFVTMTVNTSKGPRPRYFVVSELLNGVNLLNLITGYTKDLDGEPFEFAKMMLQRFHIDRSRFVTDIASNVLNGLSAIHRLGYIHRDIDPSNVMLTKEGKIKIIDFGIAKKVDQTGKTDTALTKAGSGMGKAVYTSPEVLSGQLEAQNASSDLYSVGIMIYALAVGRLPYSGTVTEIMIKKVSKSVPVEDINDSNLRRVVKKATDNNQKLRYATAEQFNNDLRQTPTRSSGGGSGSGSGLQAMTTAQWIIVAVGALITLAVTIFIVMSII